MNLFNKAVVSTMPMIPKALVGKIASRYVAGEQLSDAIAEVQNINKEGGLATLDILGEYSKNEAQAEQTVNSYKEILTTISDEGVDSNISIKPTALGLKMGYDVCFRNVRSIVKEAAMLNNFVRIDMEDHGCTDDTLRMYYELRKEFDNVGVVIQAYLRRTIRDVQWLKKMKANLRLCKGIYSEPRMIAYKDRDIIIQNYAFLLEELLQAGSYVGIATHCEETVWHGLKIVKQLGLNRDQYEFQMLLGVDPELRQIIMNEGHRLRVYVPYGEDWYPYSTRRLKENPQLAGSVAKDFLKLS
ncbi:MAG: proline dehydrogenase [Calditrichaeota bacterium]|nr:proline dehydrogenase [Calditrichota bacterium]